MTSLVDGLGTWLGQCFGNEQGAIKESSFSPGFGQPDLVAATPEQIPLSSPHPTADGKQKQWPLPAAYADVSSSMTQKDGSNRVSVGKVTRDSEGKGPLPLIPDDFDSPSEGLPLQPRSAPFQLSKRSNCGLDHRRVHSGLLNPPDSLPLTTRSSRPPTHRRAMSDSSSGSRRNSDSWGNHNNNNNDMVNGLSRDETGMGLVYLTGDRIKWVMP